MLQYHYNVLYSFTARSNGGVANTLPQKVKTMSHPFLRRGSRYWLLTSNLLLTDFVLLSLADNLPSVTDKNVLVEYCNDRDYKAI